MIERSLLCPRDDDSSFSRLVLAHVQGGGGVAVVVVPVEELAGPSVRKPNFEAACILDTLRAMGDYANSLGQTTISGM